MVLSVYFILFYFILMMKVLFVDVRRKNNDAFFHKSVNNMAFQELLYADDTLIIPKNNQISKKYLKYIDEESTYCSKHLHRDERVCITFNKNSPITFANGQPVKNVEEMVYPGTGQQKGGPQD